MRLCDVIFLSLCLVGCAAPAPVTASAATQRAPDGTPKAPLSWAELTPATFAKAKAERRFLVLDGSAEWCHWCHVMEATTYHDPQVRQLLAKHFLAVKVDIDSRPDIEERYGAWGWPATVIFSPDAEEIGKYRGYIAPDDFLQILREVVDNAGRKGEDESIRSRATPLAGTTAPISEEELAWIERSVEVELDDYYDTELGGWGHTQKAPLAWDNAWALSRAKAGDRVMRERALFTLDQQRAILDPVWGGIYQYSTDGDWQHPHFEKLMPFQAGALDNYATAYALTGDPKELAVAQSVRGYIDHFLTSPEGGFYATQDADLHAHEVGKRYMTGHEYYALDDAHRRALGIPRVDAREYASDNGLAIAAYVSLYEATCAKGTCDGSALATAEKASGRILATHTSPKGGLAHDANPLAHPLHLADNAAFGWGLVRLYEAGHRPEHLAAATRIADYLLKEVADTDGGGFFASSVDPDAVGVFARRRVSFEDNVLAIRFLAKLARLAPEDRRADYARAVDRALRATARPEEIKARGRMIGDFLLALEETKGVRGKAAK